MKPTISIAITTHNNRKVEVPRHPSILEVVVYAEPHESVFDAKLEAVKLCKGDWVLLLDSDDRFDNSFFNKLASINLENHKLYCPSLLGAYDFTEYVGTVTAENIDLNLDAVNFTAFMCCGSYLFHKDTYLEVAMTAGKCYRADCFYLKYLWLISSLHIEIVKNWRYEHLTQSDGIWYEYESEIWKEIPVLKEKLLNYKEVITA